MLRHPSECQPIRREEGCSSTAIGSGDTATAAVWNNPADRGSAAVAVSPDPAVP
jgi:hypothetical protein